ncbi:unnamed protein product, partial [Mesorhabditis belari]|uniref:Potassium channel domain-containing protein n=1 Tax=Mesorhabditis belari TaxID=2138241 RepID=A0AAF3FD30_9BILA
MMRKLGVHVETGVVCRELPLAGKSITQSNNNQSETQKLRLLLPHLSLISFCTFYILLSSWLLLMAEKPNELRRREAAERDFVEEKRKFDQILDYNFSTFAAFEKAMLEHLDKSAKIRFYWWEQRYTVDEQWNFPNSIFFCISMLTTIGYGTIAPATRLGRILSIVFSLFGVPLMLITVTDIGMFLGEAFKIFLENICDAGHTIIDSFYWSFITMTSIGFGDIVPESFASMTAAGVYMVIGIAITSMCIEQSVAFYIHKIHFVGRKMMMKASNITDMVNYARLLRRRPGFMLEQIDDVMLDRLRKVALQQTIEQRRSLKIEIDAGKDAESDEEGKGAFEPMDIRQFRFIDQSRGMSLITRKSTIVHAKISDEPIEFF